MMYFSRTRISSLRKEMLDSSAHLNHVCSRVGILPLHSLVMSLRDWGTPFTHLHHLCGDYCRLCGLCEIWTDLMGKGQKNHEEQPVLYWKLKPECLKFSLWGTRSCRGIGSHLVPLLGTNGCGTCSPLACWFR